MKKAGVMLIIKNGLILSVSRKNNKELFGLPGGKFNSAPPDNDKTTWNTAVRETKEETGVLVKNGHEIYCRIEPGGIVEFRKQYPDIFIHGFNNNK